MDIWSLTDKRECLGTARSASHTRQLSSPFPPFPPVQNKTRCDDFQGHSGTFRDICPGRVKHKLFRPSPKTPRLTSGSREVNSCNRHCYEENEAQKAVEEASGSGRPSML
jgi:hypothetical protein